MKKIATFLFIAISAMACVNKEAATKTTNSFFKALKQDDKVTMLINYPEMVNLDDYYKSDSISITTIEGMEEKRIKVMLTNYYTNGFGKQFTRDMTLYLRPDSLNKEQYTIYDSEGLAGLDAEDKQYQFAIKTGCIDLSKDITDQQKAEKMKTAKKIFFQEYLSLFIELRTQVKIIDWDWESSYYSKAGSGDGVCQNNSIYDIPDLKYRVKFYAPNGNIISEDDGYISYSKLQSGRSTGFSFYASYIGNANKASISVEFDDEWMEEIIVSKSYTGNEYNLYIQSHVEENLEQSTDTTSIQ